MNKKSEKIWHEIEPKGRWLLSYKVTNPMGPTAFGGYHLAVYNSPYTQRKTFLKGPNEEALNGYLINQINTLLHPEENVFERNLISWLIANPEITVVGVELDDVCLKAKQGNKITLTYLEGKELNEMEDEDLIDEVVALIVLDAGPNQLGLEKTRHVMAAVGLSYRDTRFDEAKQEKKALKSRLKSFVKKSVENAKIVKNAIEKLDESKEYFLFKEMLRTGVLTDKNGVYYFNNVAVGGNYLRVQQFFTDHPETKAEMLNVLLKK